ncbi:MAG: 5-formyltetrahydrofolate cyclo-ligase [Flavobacteriales bacterium]|nr:5-formyltetrahydrofolate cyclo-ligase [Flavobacteriales bacterium]
MKKTELRKKYNKLREKLTSEEIGKLNKSILNNLEKLNIWDKEQFHIFLTMKNKKEIDTSILINMLWERNKKLSTSVSNFKINTLLNFRYKPDTIIEINSWGIPEPINSELINDKEIDVVFVPLLAFDNKGYRVGYGKGFYDKFLANCKPDVIKIGISFFDTEDTIEDVHEADVKLDYCVTPSSTYEF